MEVEMFYLLIFKYQLLENSHSQLKQQRMEKNILLSLFIKLILLGYS